MSAQQRQRHLVIPVQADPAVVHAGDKRGPASITDARPDKLALGASRRQIRPGAAAASQGRMCTAGQRMKRVRRTRKPRRHVGNISQSSQDYAGRGVRSGTAFEIMGVRHWWDSVLTFGLI